MQDQGRPSGAAVTHQGGFRHPFRGLRAGPEGPDRRDRYLKLLTPREPEPAAPLIEGTLGRLIDTEGDQGAGSSAQAGRSLSALSDAIGLVVAAVGAAALEALLHGRGDFHAETFTFSTTFVRLLASVPLIALLLARSRAHWRLLRWAGPGLEVIVPAIAMGGIISLAGWQIASSANIVRPPAAAAQVMMCVLGVLPVAILRVARSPLGTVEPRTRRVLIVGSGVVADRVRSHFQISGANVVGFVDDDPLDATGCIGHLNDLAPLCRRHKVDHVVVAFSHSGPESLVRALRPVQGQVALTVVPRLFDVLPTNASLHDLGSGLVGISVAPATLGRGPRAWKRAVDLAGAIIALLLLSPLLLLTVLAIRLDSRGPAIFRQTRIGKDNRPFSMFKLRTMSGAPASTHPSVAGDVAMGPFPKLKEDPRVTRVGRVLRRTSLDELPQLWNVVRGEMSLVGPRPFVPNEAMCITDWAQRRHSVRPGLTGLWQVSGRNNLTFDEMCRLDSLYVSSWSPSLDLVILLRTLRVVITRFGAY